MYTRTFYCAFTFSPFLSDFFKVIVSRLGGWIILGWILERWDGVMWTGLVWLRIGTGGELL
jgi:hypothetical protein